MLIEKRYNLLIDVLKERFGACGTLCLLDEVDRKGEELAKEEKSLKSETKREGKE